MIHTEEIGVFGPHPRGFQTRRQPRPPPRAAGYWAGRPGLPALVCVSWGWFLPGPWRLGHGLPRAPSVAPPPSAVFSGRLRPGPQEDVLGDAAGQGGSPSPGWVSCFRKSWSLSGWVSSVGPERADLEHQGRAEENVFYQRPQRAAHRQPAAGALRGVGGELPLC